MRAPLSHIGGQALLDDKSQQSATEFWSGSLGSFLWVLVQGFSLSDRDKETILCTRDPDYGKLN